MMHTDWHGDFPLANWLGARHIKQRVTTGLVKTGSIMVAPVAPMPAFEALVLEPDVSVMMQSMSRSDRQGMLVLLYLFSFMPIALLQPLVGLLHRGLGWRGPAGQLCRLVCTGLRGLVFSLYYAGDPQHAPNRQVHQVIGYDPHCE